MAVQDDRRQKELCQLLGLREGEGRSEVDAFFDRQWSAEKYRLEMDDADGYTPAKMLEILKLRAIYLNQRGSTLNNPHIPKSFFANVRDQMIDVEHFSADVLAAIHQTLRDITLANETLQWTR